LKRHTTIALCPLKIEIKEKKLSPSPSITTALHSRTILGLENHERAMQTPRLGFSMVLSPPAKAKKGSQREVMPEQTVVPIMTLVRN